MVGSVWEQAQRRLKAVVSINQAHGKTDLLIKQQDCLLNSFLLVVVRWIVNEKPVSPVTTNQIQNSLYFTKKDCENWHTVV